MSKVRISEIDILKGISIIAVLLIHTTGSAVSELDKASVSYDVFAVLNRISQFAVPTFIFASAMLLMYNYGDGCDWRLFYRKRLKNVLLPYILWTALYGAYLFVAYHMPLKSILTVDNLFFGGMFYHLYFIVIIVQLYLLFPVLLHIYKFINKNIYTVVISIIVFQIAGLMLFKHVIIKYYQNSGDLLLTYMSFVMAGMYVGENIRSIMANFGKKWLYSFLAASLAGYLFVDISLDVFSNKPVNVILYNIYYYIFAIAAALFFLAVSSKILYHPVLNSMLIHTGKMSFGIYLSHPVFLDAVRHFLNTGNQYLYDIYIIMTFIIIYAASYIFTMVIKNYKFGAAVVGK